MTNAAFAEGLLNCAGSANFQSRTEDFVESAEVESQVGGEVTDANCEEPASIDVGTTYNCTGNIDGVEITFVSTIVAEDAFEVSIQE